MKRYKSAHALAHAMMDGEIPRNVYSVGYVARLLGVTRQAVHDRIKRGKLDAWSSPEGFTYVRWPPLDNGKDAE